MWASYEKQGVTRMMRSINRRIFFTLFAAITVSGFIVICTLGQTVHRHKVNSKTASVEAAKTPPAYTVTETEEGICVYKGENPKPYMILSFDPMMLSEYDREQLEKGISFRSESELRRFIEDLTS